MRAGWVTAFCAATFLGQAAFAWSNHALGTWQALSVMPELTGLAPVPAEPLESFLSSEAVGIANLLQAEERWAARMRGYPPVPRALLFRAGATDPAELHRRFAMALRINPNAPLSLFLQLRPGANLEGRPRLNEFQVTLAKHSEVVHSLVFVALRAGEAVAVADVLATASDEPDYGLDFGLWSDNGTAFGDVYELGKQPFGNPALEYSSQAPLHMGFYHESPILYMAAPFLRRTFPEYRIHLYASLASFALRTGHPYWGWRFAGWAAHYVQDLTQPYHVRVFPGVGVSRLLWINTLDVVGIHQPKIDAITLISNRHAALENYLWYRMRGDYLHGTFDDPVLQALREHSPDDGEVFADFTARSVISRQAYDEADALDRALLEATPARYVNDPSYTLGATESGVNLYAVISESPAARQEALTAAIVPLLAHFGGHTRAFLRAVIKAAST
ncbi:MAG: hypothetical protein ABSF50_15385 [Burkholderiaceae bacterium]|jgi:hypothetical protein